MLLYVLAERARLIVAVAELALLVAALIALVAFMRLYEFTLGHGKLLCFKDWTENAAGGIGVPLGGELTGRAANFYEAVREPRERQWIPNGVARELRVEDLPVTASSNVALVQRSEHRSSTAPRSR